MENRNTQRIYKMIMLVLIVIIVTSLVTAFATYQYLINNGISYSKVNTTSLEGLEYTLSQFRSELEKKYIGEINDEELIEGAVKGYVDALGDPYITYYTKKEMKTIMEETNGNFVGIGVYMTKDLEKNAILIIKPIENSPAEKAGILPGDLITKVNDVEYTGDKLEEASNKIRGEEGTKVKLEIYRNGETKTFELTRTKDIRNNGGGIVDEALKIANMLVDKDSTLLITKDKSDKEEITKATEKPIINMPTVVLVNGYSASASEILAGALKDNGKATLVGTKTYGKGIIQELHQLSDGSGLKITVSEYYTPNHNAIHKIGITPDVEIDLSEDVKQQTTIQEKDDNQLQKAIEILK